jgi:hypothetical protein
VCLPPIRVYVYKYDVLILFPNESCRAHAARVTGLQGRRGGINVATADRFLRHPSSSCLTRTTRSEDEYRVRTTPLYRVDPWRRAYYIILLCSTICVCLYLIVTRPVRREIHILYFFFFYVSTVFRPSLMFYVFSGCYHCCCYCLFSCMRVCVCVCVFVCV